MEKEYITGNSSQRGACLSTRKKMLTQKFSELGRELEIRDGSRNIIENGKGHGKLLKLKQVT